MDRFIREFLKHEQVSGMIFDMDGTLLDSMPVWSHCGERYLASLGIYAPPSLGRVLFSLTMRQGAEYMKQAYGLRQAPDEIMAGIIQSVAKAYEREIPLKPGVLPSLGLLQAAKVPMAVATSADRQLVHTAFQRLGLDGYFVGILTSTEFGSGKDSPEIFHAAASMLHSTPSSTWIVEDGLYAIQTAKAAGYKAIGVADAASREDEPAIRKAADYFVTFSE